METKTLTSSQTTDTDAKKAVHPATTTDDSPDLVVSAKNLSKSFGEVRAVRGVDLEVRSGEVVAVLGPNGAGKSTIIEMLMGLITPDSGSLEVLGKRPGQAASQGAVAAMLQTGALLEDQRVETMLKLIAGLHGAGRRLDFLIDQLGARDLLKRKVRKCSGGQRQKIRLIMALLPNPKLLILDEPTAGLDPTARRHFWESMRIQAQAGRTILFATHYLEEAEHFAARTIIVNAGQIVADGPTALVREKAASQHLKAMIPTQMWGSIQSLLEMLQLSSAEYTYRDGLFEISAPNVRQLAIALLKNEAITGVELTNASLEDTFASLTESE